MVSTPSPELSITSVTEIFASMPGRGCELLCVKDNKDKNSGILIYVIGQNDSQFYTFSRSITSCSLDNISEVHISTHQLSISAWCEMNVIYCISFSLKCTARDQFIEDQYLPKVVHLGMESYPDLLEELRLKLTR